jgi:hypothetical protein
LRLLAQDYDCQCNYALKGNGWGDWVAQWLHFASPKPGFSWQGWFGRGKAPSFGLDFAACWVNNPRECALRRSTKPTPRERVSLRRRADTCSRFLTSALRLVEAAR